MLPDLVIVHAEDIMEKKEGLERLKKSEKKYRTIFENTGTAIIIIEEDTIISLVNRQFEELSGYSREETEWKKKWTDFVIEEDLERMIKLHYSRRKNSESTQKKYEFRYVNKKGNIRDILIVLNMIPGTKRSVASLLDITERKKIEQKLKESEKKYRNILENMMEIYYETDLMGNHVYANAEYCKIIGYSKEEVIGKDYHTLYLSLIHI